MIAVLAVSKSQFLNWLRHIDQSDRNKFFLIHDENDARGVQWAGVIRLSGWQRRTKNVPLHGMIQTRMVVHERRRSSNT